jgi:hypothetical protein
LIIVAIAAMTGARAYAATDPPVRPPTQGGTACIVSTDVSDLTTGVVIHGSSFTAGNVARISIGTAALAWIVVPSSGKFDVTVAMPATLTGVQMLRVADARCSFTLRFDASAVPQSLSNPPVLPPSPLPQRVTGAGLTVRIFAAIIAGVILIGLCLLFLASRYGRRRAA